MTTVSEFWRPLFCAWMLSFAMALHAQEGAIPNTGAQPSTGSFCLEVEQMILDNPAMDAGFSTYRYYVQCDDPNDRVYAVGGFDTAGMILSSTTSFFQSTVGTYDPADPTYFPLFPDLPYDSWLTIGLDAPPAATGEVATAFLDPANGLADFENGSGFEFADAIGGGYYNLLADDNTLCGSDQRVLIAQLTTDGDISGQFRVHVVPAATPQTGIDGATFSTIGLDLDGNGIGTTTDLIILLSIYGTAGPDGDINGDGVVNWFDLSTALAPNHLEVALPIEDACLVEVFTEGEEPADPGPETVTDTVLCPSAFCLEVEQMVLDNPHMPAGFSTYRFYVRCTYEDDQVFAIGGLDTASMVVASSTAFYQSSLGYHLPPEPTYLPLLPELAYDSWLALGMDAPPTTSGESEPLFSDVTNAITAFENGDALEYADLIGGGYYVMTDAENAFCGADKRVLIAQLTTDGDITGNFRVGAIPAGTVQPGIDGATFSSIGLDVDGDGSGTAADLLILLSNYGSATALGDVDGDGTVRWNDVVMALAPDHVQFNFPIEDACALTVTTESTPPPATLGEAAEIGGGSALLEYIHIATAEDLSACSMAISLQLDPGFPPVDHVLYQWVGAETGLNYLEATYPAVVLDPNAGVNGGGDNNAGTNATAIEYGLMAAFVGIPELDGIQEPVHFSIGFSDGTTTVFAPIPGITAPSCTTLEGGPNSNTPSDIVLPCLTSFNHETHPVGTSWSSPTGVVAFEGDINLSIAPFEFNDGTSLSGTASIGIPPLPMGEGEALQLNNATAMYDLSNLSGDWVGLSIDFLDQGGMERVILDDVSYTFEFEGLELLTEIQGSVPFGNYRVEATSYERDGSRVGSLYVDGQPSTFGFGGQECWVDNLCIKPCRWMQAGQDVEGEAAGDHSGWAVSLSGDGQRMAVGAPRNDGSATSAGHVRVYQWLNGAAGWMQIGGDIDGFDYNEKFGTSVHLSEDGNRLLVGATGYFGEGLGWYDSYAMAYQWDPPSNDWIPLGQPFDGLWDPYEEMVTSFSADGQRVATGQGYGSNSDATFEFGRVQVFQWDDGQEVWAQVGSDILGTEDNAQMGLSVCLSADGSRLAVTSNIGNPGSGMLTVYEWNSAASMWEQLGEAFNVRSRGMSLSKDGNRLAAQFPGGDDYDAGRVCVYGWTESTGWSPLGQCLDGTDGDWLGSAISFSETGDRLVLGAGNAANSRGYVKVFDWNPLTAVWEQVGQTMGGERELDVFGRAVAITSNGERIAIGASGSDGSTPGFAERTRPNVGQVRAFDLCLAPEPVPTIDELLTSTSNFGSYFDLEGLLLEGSCWMSIHVTLPDFVMDDETQALILDDLGQPVPVLEPILASGGYDIDISGLEAGGTLHLALSGPNDAFTVPEITLMVPECGAGAPFCPSDIDGNGATNTQDLLVLLANFGLDCE